MVFCYLEGIADGRRLMEVAGRSPKPILIHKSNWGGAGAVIARSHSASLSSDDAVVSAALAAVRHRAGARNNGMRWRVSRRFPCRP